MKTDLTTSILAAIFGFVIAFVLTNLLVPGIDKFDFKTLQDAPDASLVEPSEDVFNYRSVNPTVEVYVGDEDDADGSQSTCISYDENGNCLSYAEE
ncbi:hypothetical protein IJ101_00085 [Candidatus Saccharibacteria bacterium]|nr:hypothetical protein [Candidatus Saccharibacteria bacterium]